MKYFIDFTTIKDIYDYHITSLYFDNFEDYIFNLSTIRNADFYKLVDSGISWGWDKEDLSDKVNDLIRNTKNNARGKK